MLRKPVKSQRLNFLPATLCCLLTACVTTNNYETFLDSWKGRADADLLKAWGAPTDTFNSSDHTFNVYQFSRTKPLGEMRDQTGGHGGHMQSFFCTVVFDVVQKRVLDWAVKGNECRNVNNPILWKTAF